MFHYPTCLCHVHKDTFSYHQTLITTYVPRESDMSKSYCPAKLQYLATAISAACRCNLFFPMELLSGQWHNRGAQSVTPYPPDMLSAVCILLHEQLMGEQGKCITSANTSIQRRAPDVGDGL